MKKNKQFMDMVKWFLIGSATGVVIYVIFILVTSMF